MKKKIEESGTIEVSQKIKREITIGDQIYQVAPPSVATIIEVSELVAQMPQVELDPQMGVTESLMIAKKCQILGDTIAVLVLGAGSHFETRTVVRKRLFGLLLQRKNVKVDVRAELAKEALKMGPTKLNETIAKLLHGQELDAFFGLVTSLIEVNLLKATKA